MSYDAARVKTPDDLLNFLAFYACARRVCGGFYPVAPGKWVFSDLRGKDFLLTASELPGDALSPKESLRAALGNHSGGVLGR